MSFALVAPHREKSEGCLKSKEEDGVIRANGRGDEILDLANVDLLS
jgi:hypothetical protein